jgi:MFS family permease
MQSAYLPGVVADLAPPAMRGSYMGMLSFSFAGALMLGSPAGGFLLERCGSGWLWAAAGGVALVGAGLYAAVGSRIRRVSA